MGSPDPGHPGLFSMGARVDPTLGIIADTYAIIPTVRTAYSVHKVLTINYWNKIHCQILRT